MAQHQDAVTSWWRKISLRAKVTGVTVAVLALGLLVTGIGTVPILRNALIDNVNAQLPSLVTSDLAGRFFDLTPDGDGGMSVTPRENASRPADYTLAIYDAGGAPLATISPGRSEVVPQLPESFDLQQATVREDQILSFQSEDGAVFHGMVTVKEAVGTYYVQLVAVPLEEVDGMIGTYFSVYTAVALVTILVAALLTRGLVTLTFRRLGHVEQAAMAIATGDFSQRLTDLEPSTEVGRLNAAINTMLDRLDRALAERERTVQQMRRFVGDASHELRTPLVSVRGYAELYRMGAIRSEEDTARAMERIEKEAIRMGAMVEDLLALTRLDEQREGEIEPLDLRPLARDAALDLRVSAPDRTVTVMDTTASAAALRGNQIPTATLPTENAARPSTRGLGSLVRGWRRNRAETGAIPLIDFTEPTDAPVATPPIILGDENRVRQVLANLLGNARRFSPEGSPVEVIVGVDHVRRVGTISIVDHGEGVPPQIREQIFQRFWRADTSRARETGGSGLGLAIVASIVQALQGTVHVEQTPGGGATFIVSLPLADPRRIPEHLLQDTQPITPIDLEQI